MEKYFKFNTNSEIDNLKAQLGREIMLNNHLRKMLKIQEDEIVNLRGELQNSNIDVMDAKEFIYNTNI